MTERLHVCFVTANTFDTIRARFELPRHLPKTAIPSRSWPSRGPVWPQTNSSRVGSGSSARRSTDAISAGLRPLPSVMRRLIAAGLGLDPEATALPPRGEGWLERLRGPVRRGLEILAYQRRVGPWAMAAAVAAPDADVFSAKALVALPVVREAARRSGARFVYDIADLHIESGG